MTNIDITGIGDKINKLPDAEDREFDGLDEYIVAVKKMVVTYAPSIRLGLAEEVLKNDDAIANIAHDVMMGDWRFNGKGSKHGYRKQCVQWSLMSYVERSSKASKNRRLSLDLSFGDGDGKKLLFADFVPDKSTTPHDIVSRQEASNLLGGRLKDLLKSGIISDQQAQYIEKHFLSGRSMVDIAKERGVSRQSVHDLISRGLKELNRVASNNQFFRGIINADEG